MSATYHERKAKGLCVYCSVPLKDDSRFISCERCRERRNGKRLVKIHYEKDVQEHPPRKTLIEKAKEAEAHGMSYGKWIAKEYLERISH